MRTLAKSRATFQRIVEERGARLRGLSFGDLKRLSENPIEHVQVESRPATIGIVVQSRPDGSLRVVVQGFLKAWIGQHVAVDGFYKHPDGTVSSMPEVELYEFD
jgi:hypothetical protein